MISQNRIYFLLIISSLILALTGCVRDDMSDCTLYTVVVKVKDTNGSEFPLAALDSTKVYLFDDDGLSRTFAVDQSQKFKFGHVTDAKMSLIAWSNIYNEKVSIASIVKNWYPESFMVKLKKAGKYTVSPPEIFYSSYNRDENGEYNLRNAGMKNDTIELYLSRVPMIMTITSIRPDIRFGPDTTGYRYEVVGPYNQISSYCDFSGDSSLYMPKAAFDPYKRYLSESFTLLPPEEGGSVTIRIYRREKLLYTTNVDTHGNPLRAASGERLNVVLDFRKINIEVNLNITEWDVVSQETEF